MRPTAPAASGQPAIATAPSPGPWRASAPGKLVIAGEYAVVDGGTALVMAVDARAVAQLTPPANHPSPTSPFLAALTAHFVTHHAEAAAALAANIMVDSSAFYQGDQKLGFGSSAAVTVAAAACVAANLPSPGAAHAPTPPPLGATTTPTTSVPAAEPPQIDRHALFALAAQIHGDVQGHRGNRGSGADIAAAVYGGMLGYQRATPPRPLPLAQGLRWVSFFTGHSADTVTLLGHVQAAKQCATRGAATAAALHALGAAGAAAVAATAHHDTPGLLRALADNAQALAQLGAAIGHDLETPAVRAVRAALAHALPGSGAVVKTTGAGGGDLALVVVPDTISVTDVATCIIQAACVPSELAPARTGVDILPPAR